MVLLPPGKATPPACCNSPRLLSCSLATINPSVLGSTAQLVLPNNITATFANRVAGNANAFNYVGPQADVLISCNSGMTTCHGHAMVAGAKSYVLENCGPDGHVWKQINVTGAQEADSIRVPKASADLRPNHDQLVRAAATDNTTKVTYSIKFYYTPEFAAVTPDIPGWVAQILSETNQGYANSQVPLQAVLCKIEAATIIDNASSLTLINNFAVMKASTALIRDSADVAFLLVNDYDSCGIAYFDVLSMSSPLTLSTAMKSCSVGYYSSGHEICHNVGCSHDKAYAGTTPYNYAYGHLIAPGGYRTIMAYPNAAYSTRVNYYSNANVNLPQTGTSTGATLENNAALLMINRMSLAAVGNELSCTALPATTTTTPTTTKPTSTTTTPTTTRPTTTTTRPTTTTTSPTTTRPTTTTTTPTTTRPTTITTKPTSTSTTPTTRPTSTTTTPTTTKATSTTTTPTTTKPISPASPCICQIPTTTVTINKP